MDDANIPYTSAPVSPEVPQVSAEIPQVAQQQVPLAAAPQQAPQAQQTPQPQPQPQAPPPSIQHDTMFGRAAKFLLGHDNVAYQVDANGQMQEVHTPQPPGQLFRSILAGALLGGAAGGQDPNGSFLKGVVRGGAASAGQAQAQGEQQDQQARAQAQQNFKNGLAAQQNQQDQSDALGKADLLKAQIAHANAETYRTNVLTQGEDLKTHEALVDADKARIATYDKSGVKPLYTGVPEDQMGTYLKNNPGASSLDWRTTGVKNTVDDKGVPHYQYTYSAYDPKQPVNVAKATIDQWDKDGLFKYHPEYKDVLKDNKQLSVEQFSSLDQMAQGYMNDNLQQTMAQAKVDEQQGKAKHTFAEAASSLSTAYKNNYETSAMKEDRNQAKDLGNALSTIGETGDLSKVPTKALPLVQKFVNQEEGRLGQELKAADTEGDTAKVNDLTKQLDQYHSLMRSSIFKTTAASAFAPVTFVNPQGQTILANTPELVQRAKQLGYKTAGQPQATPVATAGPQPPAPAPNENTGGVQGSFQ